MVTGRTDPDRTEFFSHRPEFFTVHIEEESNEKLLNRPEQIIENVLPCKC